MTEPYETALLKGTIFEFPRRGGKSLVLENLRQAARIKALEEENAALQELAGTYQVRMSDMLTRLEERYPEDFMWLKEADQ